MYESNIEMERSGEQCYTIARFPRVTGAINCTLIKIDSPGGEDAEIFRSRKGFFALNVQTVSDTNLKIRDIVVRWPGATRDQTIFNNSNLKHEFESGTFGRFLPVGDSGYTLQPYLMTKLQEARTVAENLYNESIIITRNVVERQYGVWKRRFPTLRFGMRLNLDRVMAILVATAVLHNIAVDMKDSRPNLAADFVVEDHEEEPDNVINVHNARHYRQLIINAYLSRL
ncbi:hypothetical protein Trydic_g3318 [Trypoxylus dichotomus]